MPNVLPSFLKLSLGRRPATVVSRWLWVVAFSIVAWVSIAHASGSAQESVKAFYGWYMVRVASDDPPELSKSPEIKAHVSASRLARLIRQERSPDGMESDYFMQSQDYLESWPKHISVEVINQTSRRAELAVNMGVGDQVNALRVTAILEDGRWKIDAIQQTKP